MCMCVCVCVREREREREREYTYINLYSFEMSKLQAISFAEIIIFVKVLINRLF